MITFFLQRHLRRGRKANRAALVLFFVLLAVLLVSVFQGVRSLMIL